MKQKLMNKRIQDTRQKTENQVTKKINSIELFLNRSRSVIYSRNQVSDRSKEILLPHKDIISQFVV